MKCYNIEPLLEVLKLREIDPKKGRKTVRYDVTKITGRLLYHLFFAKSNVAMNALEKLIGSSTYFSKIKSIVRLAIKDNILASDVVKTKAKNQVAEEQAGQTIRDRGLAFDHIVSSIKATIDTMNKHGLTQDQRDLIIDQETGLPVISMPGLVESLGRKILTSYNLALGGLDTVATAEQAKLIAERVIDDLVDIGVVEIVDNSAIISANMMVEEDGKLIKAPPVISRNIKGVKLTTKDKNGNTVIGDTKALLDFLMLDESSDDSKYIRASKNKPIMDAILFARNIRQIVVPTNLDLPNDTYAHDKETYIY